MTWLCKKQQAVSRSSTKSEVAVLGTAVCLEGLALNFMDMALEMFDPRPRSQIQKATLKDSWKMTHGGGSH